MVFQSVLLIGLQKITERHMEYMHVTESYLITKVLFGEKLLLLGKLYKAWLELNKVVKKNYF